MEEKGCDNCKHFIDGGICAKSDGYKCCYKKTWRSWEPREETPMTETGKKYDDDKLRYDLLPVKALRDVTQVLTFGAKKYGDNNWKITKPESRYIAAAMRHLEAYRDGEVLDPESGIHHLAHAACSLMFILQIDREKDADSQS
jgi:hypothetical protein